MSSRTSQRRSRVTEEWAPGETPRIGVAGSLPRELQAVLERVATPVGPEERGCACLVVPDLRSVPPDLERPVVVAPAVGADRLEAILTGEATRHALPRVGVETPAGDTQALLDVTLAARTPGRLSEFAVTGAADLGRVRADGIVAATPRGSREYASRHGAPTLEGDSLAFVVEPIGSVGLGSPRWATTGPALTLSVCRDEDPVGVWVDGHDAGAVPNGTSVTLTADGHIEMLV